MKTLFTNTIVNNPIMLSEDFLTEKDIAYIFMSISMVKRERKIRLVYSWKSSSHSG